MGTQAEYRRRRRQLGFLVTVGLVIALAMAFMIVMGPIKIQSLTSQIYTERETLFTIDHELQLYGNRMLLSLAQSGDRANPTWYPDFQSANTAYQDALDRIQTSKIGEFPSPDSPAIRAELDSLAALAAAAQTQSLEPRLLTQAIRQHGSALEDIHRRFETRLEERMSDVSQRTSRTQTVFAAVVLILIIASTSIWGVIANWFHRVFKSLAQRHSIMESKFDAAIMSMNEGFVILGLNGEIQETNRAAERILGQTQDQMAGRTSMDPRWRAIRDDGSPFPGEEHPAMVTLRTGEPLSAVRMGVHKPDGSLTWINVNSSVVRDDDGTVHGVLASFTDVTELHENILKLRLALEKFEAMAKTVPVGVFELIAGVGLGFRNDVFNRILGLEGNSPMLHRWADFIHPEDRDYYVNILEPQFASVSKGDDLLRFHSSVRMVKADGTVIHCLMSLQGVQPGLDGRPRYFGSLQDISELIRESNKAQRSAEFNQYLLESLHDGILTATSHGTILSANVSAAKILGVDDPADLIGEDVNRFLDNALQQKAYTMMLDVVRGLGGERSSKSVFEVYRADRTLLPAEITLTVLFENDQQVFLIVVRDLTEQKKLETELLQAQKMEGIGRLASGVAHDFNNLLSIMLLNAEELASSLEDADLKSGAQDIVTAGMRGADLVRQLLTFARRDGVSEEDVRVADVIAASATMLSRLVKPPHFLQIEPVDPSLHVKMDATHLQQLVMNLSLNSIDAMPEGGRLTIQTLAYCSWPSGEPWLNLQVMDQGVGIDPATQTKMFEPFFTTKEKDKGTGLGLAIVYGVVENMGGRIEIDSKVGQGTTFSIHLPRVLHAEEQERPQDSVEIHARSGGTVLVVEDEKDIVSIVKRGLERQGYRVFTAPNLSDANTWLDHHFEDLTVLVTDFYLAGGLGTDLVTRVREQKPKLPVLVISGNPEHPDLQAIQRDSNTALLAKPFRIHELLGSMDAIRNGDS